MRRRIMEVDDCEMVRTSALREASRRSRNVINYLHANHFSKR